ncbi:MAG: HlyD family efflux transporter periplasmic adaptor subunit [Caldilineales bacterium]|nr:HlyD family efflux transporter periplasmic adaptor subunit [Caldilineales bacterium]
MFSSPPPKHNHRQATGQTPTARGRAFLLLAAASLLLAACSQAPSPSPDRLAGIIEAGAVAVAPEIGGRLVEILVEEGDRVEAGQTVARLDDSLLQLQLDQAEAGIDQAQARLAHLRAAVRPVDVAVAQARVKQAEAALAAAASALADAQLLRDAPQQAEVEIAASEAGLAEAEARAGAARAQAEAADLTVQMWGAIVTDLRNGADAPLPGGGVIHIDAPAEKLAYANEQWNLASQNAWAAWQQSAAADAAITQARTTLADQKRLAAASQTAADRVVAAANARDQAAAGLDQAQAALAAVRSGPGPEQIAAAEAAVAQSQAVRDALAAQLDRATLRAPAAGVVTARYRQPGEIIGSGQRLLTISDPDRLTLTVYAPVRLLPQLEPGQRLSLTSPTAPGRSYEAVVRTVSDEPEFTLRQAQNTAERANAVYAVELELVTPDPLLRPGAPADALVSEN